MRDINIIRTVKKEYGVITKKAVEDFIYNNIDFCTVLLVDNCDKELNPDLAIEECNNLRRFLIISRPVFGGKIFVASSTGGKFINYNTVEDIVNEWSVHYFMIPVKGCLTIINKEILVQGVYFDVVKKEEEVFNGLKYC